MTRLTTYAEAALAILVALIWIAPLLFAFWAAFHNVSDAINFNLTAPWTMENFATAWDGAPWLRYFLNTFLLVTIVLIGQFILCTLAGFAFAQIEIPYKDTLFLLVLLQLFILPEVLIVENYAMDRGDRADRRHGLCAGVGLDPLEQLPVAADRDEFRHHAPADCGPVDLRRAGERGEHLGHFGRHRDDHRAATDPVPDLPAPVRSGLPARRDQVTGLSSGVGGQPATRHSVSVP